MAPTIENSTRKRSGESANTTDPPPPTDGSDHRKKRRNRTTQSCLNCHTSKRMCDRKRPACARCTQLGLTGLCVYEVDDPNQRADTQDETARLITRVAELEKVIREMKNKPHPRWLQSGVSNTTLCDAAHERLWLHRSNQHPHRGGSSGSHHMSRSSSPSSPPTSDDHSNQSSPLMRAQYPSHSRSVVKGTSYPVNGTGANGLYPFRQSPQSSPSPLLATPNDEYSRPGECMPQDYDLTTMLLSYPSFAHSDHYTELTKESMQGYSADPCYCGCAEDPSSYNVLLELSLRLRKAADIMTRNPIHQPGSGCSLLRHVVDLDRYLSNLLGNVTPSPVVLNPQSTYTDPGYPPNYNTGHVPNTSPVSPTFISGAQSWDLSHHHHHHTTPPHDDTYLR